MEIVVNNIKYQLDTNKKIAEVINYQNNPVDVIIPEYVEYENKKYKVTSIGYDAFNTCTSLTSVTIPNSVTSIGDRVFNNIGITLPKRYTKDGKLIAYKGFNVDMTCRNFQYEEGKTYEIEGEIKLCKCGFHACINPLDIFNYYYGTIGKNIVIHKVYLSGDIDEDNYADSKVCVSKIEIGKRITVKDINEIINAK